MIKGLLGALTSIPCGGASLDWFLKDILSNKLSYGDIDSMVRAVKGDMPTFYPSLLAPEGSFTGLTLNHSTAHLLRSIMEGLAIEVKKRLIEMKEAGINIKRLKMVGGGAKSSIWPEIISDITKLPVSIPDNLESASVGAALLAKMRVGSSGHQLK